MGFVHIVCHVVTFLSIPVFLFILHIKGMVWMCGCLSYFSIVSVLATVDGGRHAPQFGEAGRNSDTEA